MKILQVIPYFCIGGAEIMCENLCYMLRKFGHEVTVVSLYNRQTPISDRMEAAGIRILYLDKKLGLDVSMVPKLAKIMKKEQPDVVHTHLDVIKYAVAAAKLTGIHRCFHTVHNVAKKEAEGPARTINRMYYKCGWSRPVALSPEIQRTVCDLYGLSTPEVPVIPNGVDLDHFQPKGSYSFGESMNLLHVGRLNEQKNHTGLLHAFQIILERFPQCKLHLVGDGELHQQIQVLAEELGIADSVTFHGFQNDVQPFLQSADIFVLPSLYEGIPLTIIEAMAAGLPIVATPVGGVPDMLKDQESGLLCACEPQAIADACIRLLEDEDLRRRLGQKACQDSARFSSRHMSERYTELYSAML